ncbi:DUF1524 domain-containing protein [Bdellovibrio sp.]|uniref:GmrSD restriction endonuclease domain-containing protein n=1 Tax=Bdellovibrio sp. TaxID=28201 RepID=UPI0039E233DD
MKTSLLMMLLLVALFAPTDRVQAQETSGNAQFDNYYTVKEQSSLSSEPSVSINPVDAAENFWDLSENLQELTAKIYSLLDFDNHNEKYGNVNEPYSRKKHFGTWIRDRRDTKCYNTRAKVLIRDSAVNVNFNSSGCTVASGKWADPYSGRDYTRASDIQIDHFVPLKNAYISGAYKWDKVKRCLYANFLGNDFHLLPVFGNENSRKGDRTPEEYMPLNRAYNCQYLAQWLKVKLIWSLGLTPPEKEAILSLVRDNHCNKTELSYTSQELDQQRRFIADNMNLCQ